MRGGESLNGIWCDECNVYTICIRELVQQHLRNAFAGQNKSFDPIQIEFVWEINEIQVFNDTFWN